MPFSTTSAQGVVPFTAVATQTGGATYTASVSQLIPCDVTTGNIIITLPTAPANKARIGIRLETTTYVGYVVFINTGGSDVIGEAATTQFILSGAGQTTILQYNTSNATWYQESNSLLSPGYTNEQTWRETSLDQMAPPAANLNMNFQRGIQMANGIYAQDSAAMNQSGVWTLDNNTWTHTGATTFTTAANTTSIFTQGVKLAWQESGVQKYGIVASSAYTTLTTVTMYAISNYSMAGSPTAGTNYYSSSTPASGMLLPYVAQAIAGSTAIGTTATTILTTNTLGIGIWEVDINAAFNTSATAKAVFITAAVASGTATATPVAFPMSSSEIDMAVVADGITCILKSIWIVTVAATFTISATASVASDITTTAGGNSVFIAKKIG